MLCSAIVNAVVSLTLFNLAIGNGVVILAVLFLAIVIAIVIQKYNI